MAKSSIQKKQLSIARNKRTNFGFSPIPKPQEYILGSKDISLPPESPKRVSVPTAQLSVTPPDLKRRRFKKKTLRQRETLRSLKFDEKIVKLEKKWHSVAKYCWHLQSSDLSISPRVVTQIAKDAKVSEGTLRNWVKQAMAGNSLLPKAG